MFYIRVDVNEIVATGHMMRCLAIADEMRALGDETTFLVADEQGMDFAERKGYSAICLHSRWDALEEELDCLVELIDKQEIPQILIDSYQITAKYLERLQRHTKVIYIDDLDAFLYPCEKIINYAVYASDCSYGKMENATKHLLGPAYMPLRAAFRGLPPKEIRKHIRNILVLTGGADSKHFALRFLEVYGKREECADMELTIICGQYNKDYERLQELSADRTDIVLKQSVSDIEHYMCQADVAISAGGTTLYELCACGTPTISYLLAENQQKNVDKFAALRLIPCGGDVRDVDCIPSIWAQIESWQDDIRERQEISERMQKMIDGNGAMRIAQKLLGSV